MTKPNKERIALSTVTTMTLFSFATSQLLYERATPMNLEIFETVITLTGLQNDHSNKADRDNSKKDNQKPDKKLECAHEDLL